MATMTETAAASSVGEEGTILTAVTSTTEGDTVDLEEAMLSQGDDDDDVYGKSIARHQKTEQIGVRLGRNKKKTVRSRRKNMRHCDTLRLNCRKRSRNVKSRRNRRHR